MKPVRSEPIFAVSDVEATVRYYLDVLGFERHWFWRGDGDDGPATFGGAGWDDVHVMFSLMPDVAAGVEGHEHWFSVDDVDALHEKHQSLGAEIVSPIANRPWGVREYVVRDPNGYRLRFAGPAEYNRPATAISKVPNDVRVEIGYPSVDEYRMLAQSVGWQDQGDTMPRALEASVFCCVARVVGTCEAVGMLRVSGDGRQYTICDVMVCPDRQNQRIGSALVELALEELRRIAPKGTYVGLFTGKPSFYERFGFRDAGGMSLTL